MTRGMADSDRDALKASLRALLEQCAGPDAAVTMTALFHTATGEPVIPGRRYDQTRVVRSLVEQLRREGCPIGVKGGPHGGYFWATDPAQLDPTIQVFHQRALSSLRQEAALKRMPFPGVLEQHRIEFEQSTQETPDAG